MAVNAYYGISVTLADTAAHNLLALLQAVDSSLNGVLHTCAALSIQADQSNGANGVLVGDASVSTGRFGYELLVHDQNPYRSITNQNVPLSAIWVLARAATCQLNVEVWFL